MSSFPSLAAVLPFAPTPHLIVINVTSDTEIQLTDTSSPSQTALAAILSFLNRTSIRSSNTTPLTINIIADLILSFGVGLAALRTTGDLTRGLSYARCGEKKFPPGQAIKWCKGWVILVASLVGVGVLGGAIIGWVSSVLHLDLRYDC
jgi:hypothetical protein